MSSNEIAILWLDPYIGVLGEYVPLKKAFSTSIDPTYPCPTDLYDRDIRTLIFNETNPILQYQSQGPCELQFFTDEEQCLESINKCLDANKQIFLILPDNVRKDFFLRIYEQRPAEFQKTQNEISIKFYIFMFMPQIEDWFFDYEDCIRIYYHEAELLYALIRDIAIHYMTIGKQLLDRNTVDDTQQALIYFQWANTLILRGNSISPYKEIVMQTYLETMIDNSENKIRSVATENYLQYDRMNKLIENIFIYCPVELNEQALKLGALFNRVLNKTPLLFNDLIDFSCNLQLKSYTNQHNCPIIITENVSNETNIFKELSSLPSIEHIYVLNISERKLIEEKKYRTLLEKFSKICNIFSNMQALARRWIIEHSTECERMGDYFKETGNSKQADLYYEKSIKLNECVSFFIKRK